MHQILDDLLAAGTALFGQGNRLLKLRFSEGCGFAETTLLAHRLVANEGLSSCYRYELDCLSPDAFLELKHLLGQPCEITLLLPADGVRLLTGLVTRAEQTGGDGGFSSYRLTIEPALATLSHRRNSRVFTDLSVPDIVAAVLDEHLAANPVFTTSFKYRNDLRRDYPSRSYTLQYRESDLAFIERLLAEEGISYRFTHGTNPDSSVADREPHAGDPIVHTLTLFDADSPHPAAGESAIRFHRTDGVDTADAIDRWEANRDLQSGQTQLVSWDYKAASQNPGGETQQTRLGEAATQLVSTLEDFEPQAGYYAGDPQESTRYALLRQQAKDFASKSFSGAGTARHLLPGTWFPLIEHPVHDQDKAEDREFLVTQLSFEAENNLSPDARQQLGGLLAQASREAIDPSRPPYRNTFSAVRRHVPVVPAYQATRHQKPTAHGLTTATVVGPAGEEIFTDEFGRIRIQFHWQRKKDHPDGGADRDDRSSTWVRVAMPSAGAGWGNQFIPRVGQEVVVDFIESDIDRPLVTGVVFNGTHRPPTFSGAGSLPANKTLSGLKSKEYRGNRYNELLFDDSTNEIRTKLSSEHGKTQLNQGFLIHPRADGKGEARGEGFELRTDESGALRAAKGVLISAEARGQAVGNQLDRGGLLGQLQTAEGIARSLSNLSAQHGAENTETGQQTQLLKHLENWEKGSNTANKESPADGGKPIVALSAPLGIAAATPESMTLTAGHNLDLCSVKHANLSIGGKWLARVGESFSLFVHKLGMKLIAAGGHIDIQAQDGEIRISANKKITISSNEEIVYQAPKVTAIAQGVQIDLATGNITAQCSGTYTQKAAQHNLDGPGSGSVQGAFAPRDAKFDQQAVLTWMGSGEAIQNRRYRLWLEDGRVLEGITNAAGQTEQMQSEIGYARYRLELLPDHS